MCSVRDVRAQGLGQSGDMPYDVIDRVFSEASPYQPAVELIGGEPLLYPQLPDAIQLASKGKILAVVTTNGLRLKENAEALVRAELPMLQVSLDGWDESSQAARGHVPESFQRLCEGVQAVLQARGSRSFPIVRILTAITRVNYAHLDRIQQVVNKLKVKSWGVANYFYLNRSAREKHTEFALIQGLPGHVTAHAINDSTYLSPEQVQELRLSLARVRGRTSLCNLGLRMHGTSISKNTTRHSSLRPLRRLTCHTTGSTCTLTAV
jgi:MoaA/NifB/PqqE/SkfB family radical SAM enzyme